MLQVIDNQWKDHLLSMDELKQGIGNRAYGQKDPLVEYKKESYELFTAMMDRIEDETVRYLFFLQVNTGATPVGPFPEEEEEDDDDESARPDPSEQQRLAAKNSMEDFTRNIQRKKEKELAELHFGAGRQRHHQAGGEPATRWAGTTRAPAEAGRNTRSVTAHRKPRLRHRRLYEHEFLVTALLLPCLASAAILPEAIGDLHRASTWRPALTDRALWDEYGLKSAEAAVYENDTSKLNVTVWQLPDTTGAMAAFEWQRPADSKAITARQDGGGNGEYVIARRGKLPDLIFRGRARKTRDRRPGAVAQKRRYDVASDPGRLPPLGRPGSQQRAVHHGTGRRWPHSMPGDSSFGSRLPLRRGGPVGRCSTLPRAT